ncbi:MAG: non-homologous end-joining DNA ligase [Thermomicrobiales bacterium]
MTAANQTTAKRTVTIDGRQVTLSSPDKVMFPGSGLTKAGVIDYVTAIAAVILPQLRNRPVTRIRFPDGFGGERFFEKNLPRYAPDWLRAFTIDASPGDPASKDVRYPVIDDLAGLVWMANQAALELHTPQWRIGPRGGVRRPDRLVIDLDPGEGTTLDDCAEVARLVADRLRAEGLVPVSSGGKGIHVYAALDGQRTALAVHDWVKALGRVLETAHPDRIVTNVRKEHRGGRIFLDWSQNHPSRSTATPYTLRAKGPNPTVAAPRFWDEIAPGIVQLGPDEVRRRLDEHGDIFALVATGASPAERRKTDGYEDDFGERFDARCEASRREAGRVRGCSCADARSWRGAGADEGVLHLRQ